MIIRTNVNIPKISSIKRVEETKVVEKIDEEVIVKPVSKKSERRKKTTPVYSVVEEEVKESEIDEDLSEWLKDDIED